MKYIKSYFKALGQLIGALLGVTLIGCIAGVLISHFKYGYIIFEGIIFLSAI